MARLEDLTRGATVEGVLPEGVVTVIDAKWHGSSVVELTYKDAGGRLGNELLYRDREPGLEVVQAGRPWSFDGDGELLRLVSEAKRIDLAHLFDPLLAVHTSLIEPLPHQITAVYGEMLSRQPLRFLLADDPGAGKTIMAGLLIKELSIRGDVHRCLICAPGSLVEQWQDELALKFHLPFEIVSRATIEASLTGNPFAEKNLVIARLDQMARSDDVQAKLSQTDWDLVVCDEAHKMSASFFSGEVRETKRYRLGRLLGQISRHLLLMTATPHNGKEEDFQLFMALLDADRFEGRFRDGVHTAETSDLMRRLIKESLVKFDGTPLFPERIAHTTDYHLSEPEAVLYHDVTQYVTEEMNRADRLAEAGEGRRANQVGFALTSLQRRLASSPEAIYQSLRRRRERLDKRLREEKLQKRGADAALETDAAELPDFSEDDIDDLDDAPEEEVHQLEEQVMDRATAARTIHELELEIQALKRLESHAQGVLRSDTDCKWEQLSGILQNDTEMFDTNGHRRKLVIFSEHRDTVNYLIRKITTLIGRPEAVVTIHGGLAREQRRTIQEEFTQNRDVEILIATDAAGEGINLQRAHLMVNYDLPWNPNRLEQRFGRIHRIGQTEVCHLWNLVAGETREGDVYARLLHKLEKEREALGGQVFDVLGNERLFDVPLRRLLKEAIRYGDRPDIKARLQQVVDIATDRDHLRELIEERALAHDTMSAAHVQQVREDMERAAARRLQPHFIRSFFMAAFEQLGGSIREREPKRYEITHVPAVIRSRGAGDGGGHPILRKYERICFDKEQINVDGKPTAAFICPGHPLLEATICLMLERHRDLLKRGAVLVDPADNGDRLRALFYLEHAVQDARQERSGQRRVISKQLEFVEIDGAGRCITAGYAPYLDYRPLTAEERSLVTEALEADWLTGDLESRVMEHAVEHIVPRHFAEVRARQEERIAKTTAAVKDRLTKEINYWDHRANQLKDQELAGKRNDRLNSGLARQRADELQARLQRRMEELEQERRLSPLPPVVIGGALVVPIGLLARRKGETAAEGASPEVERLAMEAVMAAERALGREPRDVAADKCGYDIESRVPDTGRLLFIEVKGRTAAADTVCITKNEILTALNKPESFILAVVPVDESGAQEPRYIREPFQREPDFGVTSVNYKLAELLSRSERPT